MKLGLARLMIPMSSPETAGNARPGPVKTARSWMQRNTAPRNHSRLSERTERSMNVAMAYPAASTLDNIAKRGAHTDRAASPINTTVAAPSTHCTISGAT